VEALSGREAVVFRALQVRLSVYAVLIALVLTWETYPSGGNEGGVATEQTYDRVESTQVRDVDTRAARCKHSGTFS
jgi:hypothetical protein